MFVQIPGFSDYLVDENGVVVSLKGGKWKALKPAPNRGGYPSVVLHIAAKKHPRPVHRLVAEVFLGSRPAGGTVNHIDGNKQNNSASNLEYISIQDNIKHALQTGLRNSTGQHNPKAKLSDDDAAKLMALKGTMLQREAGNLFGITQTQVSKIWTGRQRNDKTNRTAG